MESREFNEHALNSFEVPEFRRGEVVKGRVIGKEEEGLVVDFGGKSEGFVPQEELLKPLESYRVGDVLTLQIIQLRDEDRTILSEKRPAYRETLERVKKAYEEETPVKARVVSEVKGGYRVVLEGVIPAFLPGSLSAFRRNQPIPREEFDVLIVDFSEERRGQNVVVSRKALIEKELLSFFATKKVGDVVEGKVKKVLDLGVVLEITETIEGFIPKSELSYDPSTKPSDVVRVGDSISAKIIRLEPENNKVVLSLKQLLPDPWQRIVEKYPVGKVATGVVRSIHPFGFFVTLEPGVEGLVPYSEVFWGNVRRKLEEVVRPGDVVKVEVIGVDPENKKITLSYRRAKGNPWEGVEERYPVGNVVTGKVTKIIKQGVFVELEEGLEGFVPISEISWNYVESPEELFKVGDKVRAKIVNLDKENRRLTLSVKQASENPWIRVFKELKKGSVVTGVVRKVLNSGIVVRVEDYDVDGFVPVSHVLGSHNIGDKVHLVVLRLDENERTGGRLILSEREYEEKKNLEEYRESVQNEKTQRSFEDILKKGEK